MNVCIYIPQSRSALAAACCWKPFTLRWSAMARWDWEVFSLCEWGFCSTTRFTSIAALSLMVFCLMAAPWATLPRARFSFHKKFLARASRPAPSADRRRSQLWSACRPCADQICGLLERPRSSKIHLRQECSFLKSPVILQMVIGTVSFLGISTHHPQCLGPQVMNRSNPKLEFWGGI